METKGVRGYRRSAFVVVFALIMSGFAILTSSSAFAGTLTKMSWTVSNSQTAKTGVTYAYAFTTSTSAALTKVTMTVPSGTGGTAAVGTVYGLGAGTASLAGTTLTYTITTPATVPANIPVYVSFTGLTNTSTAGTNTSTITTFVNTTAQDSGNTGAVTFGSSSTSATVTVGQTLTFTNNTASFSLSTDPSQLNNVASQQVILTIQTNASAGYTLTIADLGLARTSPAFTIPAVSTGPTVGVSTFPSSGWGVSASLSTGGTDGAALASGLSGGKWVGYPSSAANFLTTTGPTGATPDTLTLTDQVGVDYTVPAGTYSDTITYTATPSY